MNPFKLIDDVSRDAGHALRTFGRQPGLPTLVVLTLALGIGATTAMYSAIDAAFFRPLPFPRAEQLVRLTGLQLPIELPRNDPTPRPKTILEPRDLDSLRDVLPADAAYATGARNLESGPEPRRLEVTYATAELFAVLERDAAIGRVFTRDETIPGGAKVVVLSDRLWRSQFGADPQVVGRSITLDNEAHEVIGVMPRDFRFPAEAQLWAPLPVPVPWSMMTAFRNYLPTVVVGRVADGVPLATARARLDALRFALLPPPPAGEPAPPQAATSLVPLQRYLVGDRSTTLTVLMVSSALVLLVACANAATLLFTRALARGRENAVHAVLGATRARLARRLLVESVLLAGLAAALGVAIAAATLPLLEALLPTRLSGLAPAEIDWRVLAFTLGAAMATGLSFGIAPALGASRVQPAEALKSGGTRSTRSGRIGSALVVVQVAVAALLLVSSVLMIASLRTLLDTEVGLRGIDRVATARLNVPSGRYESGTASAELVQSIIERLEEAPAVEAAGAVNALPFDQEAVVSFRVDTESQASVPELERPFAPYRLVSPGYLRTIGLELVRGREFAWSDSRAEPVAVVNRTLAERLWPGEDPLGKRMEYLGPRTVVGVVADARILDLARPSPPQVYVPMQESAESYLSLVVRGREGVDAAALLPLLRDAVRAADPVLPAYAAAPLETVLGDTVAPRRLNTLLSGTFAAVALVLAAVGVYGVLAYSVAHRRREIGIRLALGAQAANVVRGVLRESLVLVVCGIALGFGGALAAARYLEALLYGVTAREPLAFGAVAVLFIGIAASAAWLPARSAASVDPLTTIRHE